MKFNKINKYGLLSHSLKDLILLLRYGTYSPTKDQQPILNIKTISDTLDIS